MPEVAGDEEGVMMSTFLHPDRDALDQIHRCLRDEGWDIDAEYKDRVVFKRYAPNAGTIVFKTVFQMGRVERGEHRPR